MIVLCGINMNDKLCTKLKKNVLTCIYSSGFHVFMCKSHLFVMIPSGVMTVNMLTHTAYINS